MADNSSYTIFMIYTIFLFVARYIIFEEYKFEFVFQYAQWYFISFLKQK